MSLRNLVFVLLYFIWIISKGLQFSMFVPGLIKLGTPEQQAKWVPKAMTLSIIGTYAQTGTGNDFFSFAKWKL